MGLVVKVETMINAVLMMSNLLTIAAPTFSLTVIDSALNVLIVLETCGPFAIMINRKFAGAP